MAIPENEVPFSEETRKGFVLFAETDEIAFAQCAVAKMVDFEKNPIYKKFFNRYTGFLPTVGGKKVTSFLQAINFDKQRLWIA